MSGDALFTSLLVHRMAVLRGTLTPDGYGGEAVQYGTLTAAVACRVRPVSLEQSVLASYMVDCESETDIRADDRAVWNGQTYRVKSVVDAAGVGHHKVVAFIELPG